MLGTPLGCRVKCCGPFTNLTENFLISLYFLNRLARWPRMRLTIRTLMAGSLRSRPSRCFGHPRVGVGAEAPALGLQQAHSLFIEGSIVEGLPGLRHGDPAHFDVSITA